MRVAVEISMHAAFVATVVAFDVAAAAALGARGSLSTGRSTSASEYLFFPLFVYDLVR